MAEIEIKTALKTSTNYGLILASLTGGAAVALSIVCYPFISPALRKVCLPYVPATTQQIENVLQALKGRSGNVLDIGSGDGRIVLATARAGFQSHGVELNPWLVLFSRLTAATTRLPAPATFSREDLWKFSLKPYKNIVVFGVEEMMPDLEKKFDSETSNETCIVACRFPLPSKKCTNIIGSGVDTVWVYKTHCVGVS